MEYTQNYQLPLWDKEDAIKRTDFNDNNSKIDAALGTLAAASAGHGNCQIVYGSYVGTGTYGSANPITLTFDHKPMFVAVMSDRSLGSAYQNLLMVRGGAFVYTFAAYHESQCTVSWAECSVSWYNASAADYQFNKSGYTYHYIALMAADE